MSAARVDPGERLYLTRRRSGASAKTYLRARLQSQAEAVEAIEQVEVGRLIEDKGLSKKG
eukprot:scaffold137_cov264-Pinguiococcus_pyrenoidosus.AAC.2